MIEQALYNHLLGQDCLTELLAEYAMEPAIFNHEAPADTDEDWETEEQYPRIVFVEDIQGDPERTIGGTLVVDIMCKDDGEGRNIFPEDIEPIVRRLIDGYFFSNGIFTAAAQWKNSSPFTQAADNVAGCTVTFELLAFPIQRTIKPDIVERLNDWSAHFGLHVINLDPLPHDVWKPDRHECAIYWRVVQEAPAHWIPDTYQTIWRTATVRGHIFAENLDDVTMIGQRLITGLYAMKRLKRDREAPVMVNQNNTLDIGADALRTGQITVEATYGRIVHFGTDDVIENIYTERENSNGK